MGSGFFRFSAIGTADDGISRLPRCCDREPFEDYALTGGDVN